MKGDARRLETTSKDRGGISFFPQKSKEVAYQVRYGRFKFNQFQLHVKGRVRHVFYPTHLGSKPFFNPFTHTGCLPERPRWRVFTGGGSFYIFGARCHCGCVLENHGLVVFFVIVLSGRGRTGGRARPTTPQLRPAVRHQPLNPATLFRYLPPSLPPPMGLHTTIPPVVGVCCEEGGTRCSKCIEMYRVSIDCIWCVCVEWFPPPCDWLRGAGEGEDHTMGKLNAEGQIQGAEGRRRRQRRASAWTH